MSGDGRVEVFCETAHDSSRRKQVLIIDDDIDFLKILRVYLQDDYKVSIVNSGQIAMEILSQLQPDLILLDYMMPDMNGAALLKTIRNREETRDIPVFFLTGKTDEEIVKECLAGKPAGYIVKPIAKAALLKKLQEFLGKGKA